MRVIHVCVRVRIRAGETADRAGAMAASRVVETEHEAACGRNRDRGQRRHRRRCSRPARAAEVLDLDLRDAEALLVAAGVRVGRDGERERVCGVREDELDVDVAGVASREGTSKACLLYTSPSPRDRG